MLSGYKMTTIGLMDELRANIKLINGCIPCFLCLVYFKLGIDVNAKRQYHGLTK